MSVCALMRVDAGSDSRETRVVVVVRSPVSIAVAAGVGRSFGSHGVGLTRMFLNVPCSVQKCWHEYVNPHGSLDFRTLCHKEDENGTKRQPIALKFVRSAGMAVTLSLQHSL